MGSGASTSAGPLSYSTATKQWSLNLANAASTDARVTSDGVYDVAVSVLPKGFVANTENTKTDQSSGEWVVKAAAPVLTWGTTLAGDNRINASEAQSGVLLSGTVTDAMPGNGTNAAAGKHYAAGIESALQGGGDAFGFVAHIVGIGKAQASLCQEFDVLGQMLVLAFA
jgi:hypothetical protein